ncbi:MAG: trypsin-like peptidase domain-containing protein [Planctomycetales bacterium]|nr:trypsin-like peptidase domain-containing protein [Planctomycetales bacterium]
MLPRCVRTGIVALGLAAFAAPPAALAQEEEAYRKALLDVEERIVALKQKVAPATVLVRALVPGAAGTPGGQGMGTGVIVSGDGEILTCSHVVDLPDAVIKVRLSDGREFRAKLLGQHRPHDYALLKIEPAGAVGSGARAGAFPSVPLGRSADLKPGDWVVAFGHPLRPNRDFLPGVTPGVVKALGQTLEAQGMRRYPDAIMHDAPLFSGNSGGPLVDLSGRLVGINAAITLQNENGFSVPVDRIRANLADLRAGKSLPEKPKVGVLEGLTTSEADEQIRLILKLRPDTGEIVLEVAPGSAAERAGLSRGDVVVAVDGRPLRSGALRRTLAAKGPGAEVRLGIVREFEGREIRARLAEEEPEPREDEGGGEGGGR